MRLRPRRRVGCCGARRASRCSRAPRRTGCSATSVETMVAVQREARLTCWPTSSARRSPPTRPVGPPSTTSSGSRTARTGMTPGRDARCQVLQHRLPLGRVRDRPGRGLRKLRPRIPCDRAMRGDARAADEVLQIGGFGVESAGGLRDGEVADLAGAAGCSAVHDTALVDGQAEAVAHPEQGEAAGVLVRRPRSVRRWRPGSRRCRCAR